MLQEVRPCKQQHRDLCSFQLTKEDGLPTPVKWRLGGIEEGWNDVGGNPSLGDPNSTQIDMPGKWKKLCPSGKHWRVCRGPELAAPVGRWQCLVTSGSSLAELRMRSGERLTNGPALSTVLSLVLLSPSKRECEGMCILALSKAGNQVQQELWRYQCLLIPLTFSCKETQCLVFNQRGFVDDYKIICHGSFFMLIEFMMRFLSKKVQNVSAHTGMAETLRNHWPGEKPRNIFMLLSWHLI